MFKALKHGLLALTMLLILPVHSKAADGGTGFVLFPSFIIQQLNGTSAGDSNSFNVDIRAGYRVPSGFYFGLIFSSMATSGTNTLSATSIGNSIGYFYGILGAVTSIYLYALENETTPSQSVQRSNGLGFQQDLAALFPLGSAFSVGPMLTYRAITYSKQQDSSGTISSNNQTISSLTPYLALNLLF